MLTLNDCGIRSLENFPYLTNLIRLDMVFNFLRGEDLGKLRVCRHLQTLMLGANNIERFEDLEQLTICKDLMQLDLINNPVYKLPGYR
jgi:Leucine-rich repeat (LRR) protein